MRIRSIGSKLTLWYTGLLTLTFLLLGSVAYSLMNYSLSRDMDYALQSIGKVMATKAREEGNFFYPSDIDELFRRFFGFSPLERHFDVFTPGERAGAGRTGDPLMKGPLSPEVQQRAAQGESTFETLTAAGRSPVRVLTVPIIDSGRLVNLIRVGMSLQNMQQTLRRFLLIMIMDALFPLALLLAGGGGWLFARRALRPVDEMTKTARKISGERLKDRLEESGNGDELEQVMTSMSVLGSQATLDRLPLLQLRERIVKSYGALLENHPEMAGRVARDISMWQLQTHVDRLTAIQNAKALSEPSDIYLLDYYLSMARRYPRMMFLGAD